VAGTIVNLSSIAARRTHPNLLAYSVSTAALDTVVTNPPFHAGRAADPDLGRAFIAAAAAMLKPGGQLWLVANRHLPYETAMAAQFRSVEEVAGDARFKILQGKGPKGPKGLSRKGS
jgi:16S rRNA (guanine1207-N2)-methyltransferase